MTGRTKQRGYAGGWGKLRASWQRRIDSGEIVRCRRGPACTFAEMLPDTSIVGGLILPGMEWDLGHDDRDRSLPPHPEHRSCNRRTNGRGGSRKRPQEPHPGLGPHAWRSHAEALRGRSLSVLRTAAVLSRRSLEKIGEGDWTPQDSAHLHIVMTVEKFLAGDPQLRTGRIVHGDA